MSWVKLTRRSDWYNLYYSHVPHSPSSMSRIKEQAVVSNIGKKVNIKWPTGNITEEVIASKEVYEEHVRSILPVIRVSYHGVTLDVDLDKVEVWRAEWPLFWTK